ncbi:LytR C-terminal domain-containing protein [Streptomyces sp. PBH53]|uniref:LytR C-terminal domain-containing protein n=1 Tax=Streptomyces sp. PBH53 TaxID=1577075 RepID=UPI000AF651D4|nr:LytR C-terminal domain-containing protein [Streptomyces sp. PBH53]
MSMLTPPGMGGREYRITGGKYPRMRPPRRRGRLVAAVVASVAALGLTGWGALQLIDVFTGGGDTASATGPAARCRTKAAAAPATRLEPLPKPAGITVNVYNATRRTGLAKSTADELKKRGFRIGRVGNASKQYDKKVKGTGILLGTPAAQHTALRVLATQLAHADLRADTRKGTDVDLIIGDAFKGLAKQETAHRALTELATPKPAATGKKSC